jgi:two-component system phosphate regulon sensor histidine kinase PhoR
MRSALGSATTVHEGGLRRNLIVATMGATAAVVVAIVLLGDPLVSYRVRRHALSELDATAHHVAERLRAGDAPDALADRMGADSGVRVTILDHAGEVIGDSAYDPPRLGEVRVDAPFVARTRVTGVAHDDPAHGGRRLRVALRASDDRIVFVQMGTDMLDGIHESLRDLVVLVGVLATVMGLALTWALSRILVRPVRELTDVADALARGELGARTRSEREDEIGQIGRAIDGMAEELAERHRSLRAEEARLRIVLDSMGEAVFVTDRRGAIILTNASLDRMMGVGAIGRSVPEVIRNPELNQAVAAARRGTATGVEFDTMVQGERRSLDALVTPLPSGAGVVGVIHDVTKLKLADRVRRDFVANASHELRTPLTAIRGYAETVRVALDGEPESARRFLDVILKHALRLQRLVDDMVSLSRAESPEQRFDVAPLDVTPVVVEVVRGLEVQAREKDLHLILELPPGGARAEGNEHALDQILVNLVDNAIKYTPSGGSVRVSVTTGPEGVAITVRDSGPGIAQQHLERIFERFYRVDEGRSREVGGTGLGLSIVRHLAQRIGAQVKVESKPGAGSTFRVSLRGAP